jgi:carbonic anhydrase/acetyltransferase-like protein (isoleucine patch superfamily)
MLKVVLRAPNPIFPFHEPARDLRLQNYPIPQRREEMLVYRDNLFFDAPYIEKFLQEARRLRKPVRAAFSASDPAFREHALPLSVSYTPAGNLYLADLWYYPHGPVPDAEPLVIDLESREIGYYHVPTYMADETGDLTFYVPLRALMAIDSWVHIFIADIVFGLFARGARFEKRLAEDLGFKLRILARALYEGKQLLECSELVKIGKNCVIDPTAILHGPTTIGDNVTIGAGAVIENCIIGNNVNISQGCQLMLSVVGDGAFLPFRAALFMTTLMEHSMVAQNTCLQLCVIGRNTFIGAGSTWTDYNLIPIPIRARDGHGELKPANRPVMGGCVGHNCRIGSGMVVYPARIIDSDVVLAATQERRVITRDVHFEESDHHRWLKGNVHQALYHHPKPDAESW